MTVRELLTKLDSREIAEWMAYERAFGPVGNMYTHATLGSIQEQLQLVAFLQGGMFEENPAPEPQRWPRPDELLAGQLEDEGMDRVEFDRLL